MAKNLPNSQVVIRERREKIWALARGNIKSYEIAKQLNVSPPTIARDIKFLTADSQNYLLLWVVLFHVLQCMMALVLGGTYAITTFATFYFRLPLRKQ